MKDFDRKVAQAMGLKSVNNCEKWVGLTDAEIDEESSDYDEPGYAYGFRQGALWAEAKLKEKNT